jgi:hypothetical protein
MTSRSLHEYRLALDRLQRPAVLLLLAASAVALAAAPLALDSSYSWTRHTTSEAAGQGVDGAWVARLGFLLFGFAVLLLTRLAGKRWGFRATLLLGSFGVLMIATAAFSHRHWLPGVPYDSTEDALHSFTATAMGFAFAPGVLAVAIEHRAETDRWRLLDVIALAASVAIPLAMSQSAEYAGGLQRAMFLIAYIWYANECLEGGAEAPDGGKVL